MLERLKAIDTSLFLLINGNHNVILDTLMWSISNRFFWIPLYLYLFYILFKQEGKNSWKIVLVVIITISLSDQISVHFFKNVFLRYRPCHNLILQQQIHLINGYCGGLYGFVSSHAANSFALFTLLGLTLNKNKFIFVLLFVYAFLNCYSRIYLGVHYPADVVCGALIGIGIAFIVAKSYLFLNIKAK
jgi:undecaprenyl-diphosphatase